MEKKFKLNDSYKIGGTTAGLIRETAATCAQASAALRKLFPSVFEEDSLFRTPLFSLSISPRVGGNLVGQGYFLDGKGWEVIVDDLGVSVLVQRRTV